jgi:hypothetical protein
MIELDDTVQRLLPAHAGDFVLNTDARVYYRIDARGKLLYSFPYHWIIEGCVSFSFNSIHYYLKRRSDD